MLTLLCAAGVLQLVLLAWCTVVAIRQRWFWAPGPAVIGLVALGVGLFNSLAATTRSLTGGLGRNLGAESAATTANVSYAVSLVFTIAALVICILAAMRPRANAEPKT